MLYKKDSHSEMEKQWHIMLKWKDIDRAYDIWNNEGFSCTNGNFICK